MFLSYVREDNGVGQISRYQILKSILKNHISLTNLLSQF